RQCGWEPENEIRVHKVKFEKPVAIAPVQWFLDVLINEFMYLSTFEMNVKSHAWNIAIDENRLHLGFDLHFSKLPSEATRLAVSNQEFSDLYLLPLGDDLPDYKAITNFDNDVARVAIECGMEGFPIARSLLTC